jgi:hypothetical protein
MRVPVQNKVPDRPDVVPSLFSESDTRGAPLDFGVRSDYRGKREVLEEHGGPQCLPRQCRQLFSHSHRAGGDDFPGGRSSSSWPTEVRP